MSRPQLASDVRSAYDEVADSYADRFRSTEPEEAIDIAMIEHFGSLLQAPKKVLDAGCGAGRMLPVLAAMNCDVEGVDLSPGMVRRARRDHPSFTTTVASLTDLPFPDSCFDGYFSWYSTIHLPDSELPLVVDEVRRVLRPGGVALLAFQSGTGTRDVSEAYRRHGHDIVLERYNRTADQVAAALSVGGLQEVARLERSAVSPHERDGQAVVIAKV